MSYYTEEQAKTKWCPLATASHTDPRAGFNDDGRTPIFPCIGSKCMAWETRERAGNELTLTSDEADRLMTYHPAHYELVETIEDADCKVLSVAADIGYCGAFGRL